MSENRRQILDMLAQGKITADEAERLIAALEREPAASSGSALRSAAPEQDQISARRGRCAERP